MNEKLKEQLKDLSLNNQPLMTSFVTIGPKLERVPVGPGTHRNPFDSPGVRRENKPMTSYSPVRSRSKSGSNEASHEATCAEKKRHPYRG